MLDERYDYLARLARRHMGVATACITLIALYRAKTAGRNRIELY